MEPDAAASQPHKTSYAVLVFDEEGRQRYRFKDRLTAAYELSVNSELVWMACTQRLTERRSLLQGRDGKLYRFKYEEQPLEEEPYGIELDGSNWKPCPSYPRYDVSDLGQIRNRRRRKIVEPRLTGFGYLEASVYEIGQRATQYVHRLVAQTWLESPTEDRNRKVRHKDDNKRNNAVSNLEWTTTPETPMQYFSSPNPPPLDCVAVEQLDDSDRVLRRFQSISEASRSLRLHASSISEAISGRLDTCGGFRWRRTPPKPRRVSFAGLPPLGVSD